MTVLYTTRNNVIRVVQDDEGLLLQKNVGDRNTWVDCDLLIRPKTLTAAKRNARFWAGC